YDILFSELLQVFFLKKQFVILKSEYYLKLIDFSFAKLQQYGKINNISFCKEYHRDPLKCNNLLL
ncbi:MAG: hypothetical protein WBJ13_05965, partial [Sedimentibacter sp.]